MMQISDGAIQLLARLLEARTGQVLAVDRRWRIEMALGPLMRERGITSPDLFVGALVAGHDPELVERTIDALLNNETFFYRDFTAFELFAQRALDRIAKTHHADRHLRLWCAGCSTGQEAYTLAMIFAERPDRWRSWQIEIVASDISAYAIERAREGFYTQFEIQRGLPVKQMMRWFTSEDGGWRVSPILRHAVRFQQHNLMDAPPAGAKFDAILCRNVLIYFSSRVRRSVFARLAAVIAADGVLMLGAGETVIGQTDAFVSDYEARGLFRPIIGAPAPLQAPLPAGLRRG